jgi:hypothetical protein
MGRPVAALCHYYIRQCPLCEVCQALSDVYLLYTAFTKLAPFLLHLYTNRLFVNTTLRLAIIAENIWSRDQNIPG